MKPTFAPVAICLMTVISVFEVHAQRNNLPVDVEDAWLPDDIAQAVVNVDVNAETQQGHRPLLTLDPVDPIQKPGPGMAKRAIAPLKAAAEEDQMSSRQPGGGGGGGGEKMSEECKALARKLGNELKTFIKDTRKTVVDVGAFLTAVGQKRAEMGEKLAAAGCLKQQ